MDGFIIAMYSGFWVVWQSVIQLIATFPFAFPLVLGYQGNRRKMPVSFSHDGKFQFSRIMVIVKISERVNDIARYISSIPGIQEVLFLRIHRTERENLRIDRNTVEGKPTRDLKCDWYNSVKQYFSNLGITARIAILSVPSHFTTPRILNYIARWQGSLVVVDQETIPLIQGMFDISSHSIVSKRPLLPVMVIPCGEISRFLQNDSPFSRLLIPFHDRTDSNHLLTFIKSIPGNKEVVLLYFSSCNPLAENEGIPMNKIEQRLNTLAEAIRQDGRTVTLLISPGYPEQEIGMIAEVHNVSVVAVMDGGWWPGNLSRSGAITSVPFPYCIVPVLILPASGWIFDQGFEVAVGSIRRYEWKSADRSIMYD
jgi:hypothetical protein